MANPLLGSHTTRTRTRELWHIKQKHQWWTIIQNFSKKIHEMKSKRFVLLNRSTRKIEHNFRCSDLYEIREKSHCLHKMIYCSRTWLNFWSLDQIFKTSRKCWQSIGFKATLWQFIVRQLSAWKTIFLSLAILFEWMPDIRAAAAAAALVETSGRRSCFFRHAIVVFIVCHRPSRLPRRVFDVYCQSL